MRIKLKVRGVRDRMLGSSYEMAGRHHCPPSGEAVTAWPAYFSAGSTFQQYLPRRVIARSLLGRSPGWKPKATSRPAKGLARSGDRIHAPKPAGIHRGIVWKPAVRRIRTGGIGRLGVFSPRPVCMPAFSEAAAPVNKWMEIRPSMPQLRYGRGGDALR